MSKELQKRLQSLPVQYRTAKVEGLDFEARTVTFALTSENPVERWYGIEILDHSAGSIDTTRLDAGVPALFNHDRSAHLGRIESYEVKDSKLYVTARFGNSALAQEKLVDIRDGILVDASAGYIPSDYEFTEGKNGQPDTIRWKNWQPVEGSFVTIPADITVGVGRSADGAESFPVRRLKRDDDADDDDQDCGCDCSACAEGNHDLCTTKDCTGMERGAEGVIEPAAAERGNSMTEAELKAMREEAAKVERERMNEINAIQREHSAHFTVEAATDAISRGASVDEVRKAVLTNQREASKAGAVRSGEQTVEPGVNVVRDADDKREKGITMARTIRSLAASKGDFTRAERFAREVLNDNLVARSFAAAASSAADGGYLMQGTVSSEIIELLRPMAVVRSLNPTIVPLDGTFTQNRLIGGASGGYIGENKDIPASKGKFGQLKLSAKKLAALVPVSNDLLRRSGGPSADAAVRDDLMVSLANQEDVAFIRNQGTQYSPRGLRNWVLPANLIQASDLSALTGNALIQAIYSDLGKLRLALRSANVRFLRPGYILSPRTEYFLQTVVNGFGLAVFREEMAKGLLNGSPYRVTTQIPENLSGASVGNVTGGSELYFADFADVTIGDAPAIGIEFSTEASYIDPTTQQLVSAFSQDQTVMRVIIEHDLGMRHQEGLAILNGVTWGK